MASEITLNNKEEFQEMIDKKDFTIAKAIVEAILSNINSRKKFIHILSITCIEDNAIYDITLEKKYFVETLQENLKYYVEKELYEDCIKITEAIKQLNIKKLDGSKTNRNKMGS